MPDIYHPTPESERYESLFRRIESLEQQVAQMRDLLERADFKTLPPSIRRMFPVEGVSGT